MFPDASSAIPRGFSPVVPTVVALPAGDPGHRVGLSWRCRRCRKGPRRCRRPGIGLCQAHGLVGPWLIRGGGPIAPTPIAMAALAVTKNVPRRRRESVAMGTAFS